MTASREVGIMININNVYSTFIYIYKLD